MNAATGESVKESKWAVALWVVCVAIAAVLAGASFIINVYNLEWASVVPPQVDADAVDAASFLMRLACAPAAVAIFLPVKSWVLRVFAAGIVIVAASRLFWLASL
ncbi:hypothetical protein [Nonomuraea sp. NPDC050202]|uniref:hypothetical protein n=1 Tax=Nonomuraea sp. NPDC050202 TaxID=3155035 RepID=UPI0033D63014